MCRKLQKDKDGYYTIKLWKNGKGYFKRVNRLVAQAFIPNPNNYECVNHKNEVRQDNRVENLEWCSIGYNNRYSKTRAIVQLNLEGEFIKEYNSILEAAQELNIASSHIQDCCANKKHHNTYKGYKWKYKEDYYN